MALKYFPRLVKLGESMPRGLRVLLVLCVEGGRWLWIPVTARSKKKNAYSTAPYTAPCISSESPVA